MSKSLRNIYSITHLQIVASLNGVNGICYEHTTSEGIAVVTMLQKILTQMEKEDSFMSIHNER